MLGYIVLAVVCVGLMVFAVGAAYLATEEKTYRYDIHLTDEHEI
jgi:hypothetical protein